MTSPDLKHLNQVQLARRWSLSPRTLERWRWLNSALRFSKSVVVSFIASKTLRRLRQGSSGKTRVHWSVAMTAVGDDRMSNSDIEGLTNAELDALALCNDARQGQQIIGSVYRFLGRFVSYPNDHAHVAHALWIFHAHSGERTEITSGRKLRSRLKSNERPIRAKAEQCGLVTRRAKAACRVRGARRRRAFFTSRISSGWP